MQISFREMLESKSYQDAKEILFLEINRRQVPYRVGKDQVVAPLSSVPHPSRVESVDYSVFKNLPGEKKAKKEVKKLFPKNHKFKTIAKITN